MSFASGFNSGINLTAQLRADARARRQEERQADLDAKSEARAKVADEAAQLQIQSIKRKMELEQKVTNRENVERHASKIALSEFVKKAKSLDPDDVNAYADLFSEYRAKVVHPDVAASMNNIHSVYAANYADRKGTVDFLRKEARQKDNAVLAEEMSARGIDVDPNTSSGLDRIMGYKRWKMINDQVTKQNTTWESIEVDPSGYSLTPEQMESASRKLQKVGEASYKLSTLPADARQRQDAIERVSKTASGQLEDKMKAVRGGPPPQQYEATEIADAFMGMDLLMDSERALENLGAPTGKGVGYIASQIMSFAQQDMSIADFKSAITRLIPKLARGTFGEVGVLTEPDIEAYRSTVASLGNTPEANKLVMAQTQALIARNLRKKLEQMADGGTDVSRYVSQYKALKNAPTAVYRSKEEAEKYFKSDYEKRTIRPGDTIVIWNDKSKEFMTTKVQPLSFYQSNTR